MSKNWPYAKLSQDAADGGGPDKWLATVKENAYDAGVSDTTNALVVPLLTVGISLGAACTICFQKVGKLINERRQKRLAAELEAADAEEHLKKELSETI